MKNYSLLLIYFLFASLSIVAQNSETIRASTGNDIAAAVSEYGIYRFPVFVSGTVFFNDGKLAKATMNYNILNSLMMYIDDKGDTLTIAEPEKIIKIKLNDTLFFNDKKGWLENIAGNGSVNLVVRRKISVSYKKEGAFGTSNGNNAIDSYNNLSVGNTSYNLSVGQDVTLKRMFSYFLLTKEGTLLPASKSNFLSQFPKNKTEIQNYLTANKINFNKEQDLVRLLGLADGNN